MTTETITKMRKEFMDKPEWTDIDLINWFGGMIQNKFIDNADICIVQFDQRTPKYMQALLYNFLREPGVRKKKVSYPSVIIEDHWGLFTDLYNLPF